MDRTIIPLQIQNDPRKEEWIHCLHISHVHYVTDNDDGYGSGSGSDGAYDDKNYPFSKFQVKAQNKHKINYL